MNEPADLLFKRREPLHRTVAAELRRRIRTGAWEIDSVLPSEDALAAELVVGRSTIREALRGLEQEGLVVRRQGIGSFVSSHANRINGNLSALESFMDTIERAGQAPRMETVDFRLGAVPKDIAKELQVADGEEAWHLENLYFADDVEAILTEATIPLSVVPAAADVSAAIHRVPLRVFLREHRHVVVESGVLTVDAVGASEAVARLLGITKGHALLKLSGMALDTAGAPAYYIRTYINTNVYKFSVLRR